MSAKKKRPSGPSGRSKTAAERRAQGELLVKAWLNEGDARELDELRAVRGESRAEAIRWAIRDAWERQTEPRSAKTATKPR